VKLGTKDISSGYVNVLLVSIANSSLSTYENAALDEELIDRLTRNIMFLWFAGYFTSVLTSYCGVFELGFRPEILSRLVREQDVITDTFAEGKREVTYEQTVLKMPLLDSYLMEILQLFPPVDLLFRRTTSDMEILGKFVPKGARCIFIASGPQNDESLYANAE